MMQRFQIKINKLFTSSFLAASLLTYINIGLDKGAYVPLLTVSIVGITTPFPLSTPTNLNLSLFSS